MYFVFIFECLLFSQQMANRLGSSKAHTFVTSLTAAASNSESEPKIEKFLDYIGKGRSARVESADTVCFQYRIPPFVKFVLLQMFKFLFAD